MSDSLENFDPTDLSEMMEIMALIDKPASFHADPNDPLTYELADMLRSVGFKFFTLPVAGDGHLPEFQIPGRGYIGAAKIHQLVETIRQYQLEAK